MKSIESVRKRTPNRCSETQNQTSTLILSLLRFSQLIVSAIIQKWLTFHLWHRISVSQYHSCPISWQNFNPLQFHFTRTQQHFGSIDFKIIRKIYCSIMLSRCQTIQLDAISIEIFPVHDRQGKSTHVSVQSISYSVLLPICRYPFTDTLAAVLAK